MSDRVAAVVKCLPSMPEALNSNTSIYPKFGGRYNEFLLIRD
jgi:hypothetical protein